MRNLIRRVPNTGTNIPQVIADIRNALGTTAINPKCVGVMIQYGKSKTDPRNYSKTALGGHVSPFVINNSGLQTWDEVMGDSWEKTVTDNAWPYAGTFLTKSSINDVTFYLHRASDRQIEKVSTRANTYVDNYGHGGAQKNLNYSHKPSIGKPVMHGDCVTRSAWVMAAFSYSSPFRGGLTPWGMAAVYEAYTLPFNFLSKWVKIKYKDCKLPVMCD